MPSTRFNNWEGDKERTPCYGTYKYVKAHNQPRAQPQLLTFGWLEIVGQAGEETKLFSVTMLVIYVIITVGEKRTIVS